MPDIENLVIGDGFGSLGDEPRSLKEVIDSCNSLFSLDTDGGYLYKFPKLQRFTLVYGEWKSYNIHRAFLGDIERYFRVGIGSRRIIVESKQIIDGDLPFGVMGTTERIIDEFTQDTRTQEGY